MKKTEKKLFIIMFSAIIGIILVISLCIALSVRKSVYVFKYENIKQISEEAYYYPFQDLALTNGYYEEVSNDFHPIEKSNHILIGKATGNRNVLEGTIVTEIEVISNLKGQIDSGYIFIYEPIEIVDGEIKTISSYDGYNLIHNDKEYIFCLSDSIKGAYMYTTPKYAKFPYKHSEADFKVVNVSTFSEEETFYDSYMGYEQLFESKADFDKYLNIYEQLLQLSKLLR